MLELLDSLDKDCVQEAVITDTKSFALQAFSSKPNFVDEKLGWGSSSAQPSYIKYIARAAKTFDKAHQTTEKGFHATLLKSVSGSKKTKGCYKPDALLATLSNHARDNGVDIKTTVESLMATQPPSPLPFDRKSTLTGMYDSAVAAQLISPATLNKTTLVSIDFGFFKTIGGAVLKPANAQGQRETYSLCVRHGDYFQRTSRNRAEQLREDRAPSVALDLTVRRMIECGKRRFHYQFAESIRQFADAAHGTGNYRDPIILIGDGGTTGGKGYRHAAYKELTDFLSEFFMVVTVNERNTSQKCPRCWQQAEYADNRREIRTKVCKNCIVSNPPTTNPPNPFFKYDRDTAAGVSLASIFHCSVNGWSRPDEFSATPTGMPNHP